MSEFEKGAWKSVHLCNDCGYELDEQSVYFDRVCPGCAVTATLCLKTVFTAKRWVPTFKPSFLQRCAMRKELGYWEWSGKAGGSGDCIGVTGMRPGRSIAAGMNITAIAAAGIASGLF